MLPKSWSGLTRYHDASPASARRDVLQQYLRVFFGGSREALMTTLLAQEAWTAEELDVLQAQIDRVRKERSRS